MSDRINVSEETIYATAREVVATNPDYVYRPPADGYCKYVHTDAQGRQTCGCVVGHVAHKLGVPLNDLVQHEGKSAHEIIRTFFTITGNARRVEGFLNEIQDRQDSGDPWGDALRHAEIYMPTKVEL